MKHFQPYFPKNDAKELEEGSYKNLTVEEKERWKIFRNAMVKTEWMKQHLLKSQNGFCPICKEELLIGKSVIHHLDYEQLCIYPNSVRVPYPTKSRAGRTKPNANCAKCADISQCVSKVVLIHRSCHYSLHLAEGRFV